MKYNFAMNGRHEGSVDFTPDGVEVYFLQPGLQRFMMELVEERQPTDIEELVLSGFSYWDIQEEGAET